MDAKTSSSSSPSSSLLSGKVGVVEEDEAGGGGEGDQDEEGGDEARREAGELVPKVKAGEGVVECIVGGVGGEEVEGCRGDAGAATAAAAAKAKSEVCRRTFGRWDLVVMGFEEEEGGRFAQGVSGVFVMSTRGSLMMAAMSDDGGWVGG